MRRLCCIVLAATALGAGGASASPTPLTPVTTPGGWISTNGQGWLGTSFVHCAFNPLLKTAWAAAVSPDGRNVYIVGRYANSLVAFARDPSTGALTQLPEPGGCFTKHGSDGCAVGRALWEPVDVAVSPDGMNVSSPRDSAVASPCSDATSMGRSPSSPARKGA